MQDKEFEESAAIDVLKEKEKEDKLKRQEVRVAINLFANLSMSNKISTLQLQQKYMEKWSNCLHTAGGLKLSIRLPNSQKVMCCLPRESSAKVK